MILIFTEDKDLSSSKVFEWMDFYKTPYIIVYEDTPLELIHLEIENSCSAFSFSIDGDCLNFNDISGVWYRRGRLQFSYPEITSSKLAFTKNEYVVVENYLVHMFNNIPSINLINVGTVNKLIMLELAIKAGLRVPKSLITGEKKKVEYFFPDEAIINKPIFENMVRFNDETWISKVREVNINELEESEGLSLFQVNVRKEFELRIFHFFGKNYVIAMFTQMNERTTLDFRSYGLEKPNRCVPFILPDEIDTKITKFMQMAGHNTGSIDMIYTKNGDFIFLEVNPIGQYDMVSVPGNYFLDKLIAQKLTDFYNRHQLN